MNPFNEVYPPYHIPGQALFVGAKGGNQGDKLTHNTATESSSAKQRDLGNPSSASSKYRNSGSEEKFSR